MSRLEELIQKLCPDGVECRNLEDCCIILDNKRKPVTKSARESGAYPYYGANGIQDHVSDYIFDGTFVLVGEDGSVVTEKGTPVVTWASGKIWVNNHAHIISEKDGVSLRFLFHYLQTVNVKPLIHGNIPKLTGGDFRTLQIPVPPLEVQREIVRILDNFTELTAELTARKQQYEYYRDKLLTYTDYSKQYRVVPLGSVADIGDGLHGTPNYDDKSEYYFVNGNNIKDGRIHITENTKCVSDEDYNKYNILFDENTLFMSINGTIGNVGKYNGESIVLGKSIAYFNVYPEELYSRYLFHYLQSSESKKYYASVVTGGTIKNLGLKALRNYSIVLPNIEIQKEISSILDNFESICSDLTSGLPSEIEARQKQYEYYREKLLTFKEKVA